MLPKINSCTYMTDPCNKVKYETPMSVLISKKTTPKTNASMFIEIETTG